MLVHARKIQTLKFYICPYAMARFGLACLHTTSTCFCSTQYVIFNMYGIPTTFAHMFNIDNNFVILLLKWVFVIEMKLK